MFAYRFFWLRFTRAGKVWTCARGQHCDKGGMIDVGEWHATAATKAMTYKSGRKWSIQRHFHIACLSPWAEYQCEVLSKEVPMRGRPKGSVQALFTAEENALRRKHIDRRKYLVKKLVAAMEPREALILAREAFIEIRAIIGPSRRPFQSNERLSALKRVLTCSGKNGEEDFLCELEQESPHCIHCSRCFDWQHGCLERKLRLR